jgi:hypothetical protein
MQFWPYLESIRTPTVRTTVPRAQNRPLNWTFMWWCRLGSNQCPSACEAAVNAADLRVSISMR